MRAAETLTACALVARETLLLFILTKPLIYILSLISPFLFGFCFLPLVENHTWRGTKNNLGKNCQRAALGDEIF